MVYRVMSREKERGKVRRKGERETTHMLMSSAMTMATEKISAFQVYLFPCNTSGAVYPGVPHRVIVFCVKKRDSPRSERSAMCAYSEED